MEAEQRGKSSTLLPPAPDLLLTNLIWLKLVSWAAARQLICGSTAVSGCLSCPPFRHNSTHSQRYDTYSEVHNALINKSPGEGKFPLWFCPPLCCWYFITYTNWFNFNAHLEDQLSFWDSIRGALHHESQPKKSCIHKVFRPPSSSPFNMLQPYGDCPNTPRLRNPVTGVEDPNANCKTKKLLTKSPVAKTDSTVKMSL